MKKITVNGLNCLLYTPQNAAENMPLIVYLHGIKGKGDDTDKLLSSDEFVQWLSDGTMGDVPAYVLIPQLPSNKKDWITIKKDVVSAIKKTAEKYKVDSENISLTGFSMGGAGVWDTAASYPQMFRCIAPCSGGSRANKNKLNALRNMKVWAFVGTADTVVKPQTTVDFMEQLAKINPEAVITKFDDAEHTDVPALAYLGNENELIYWLTEK